MPKYGRRFSYLSESRKQIFWCVESTRVRCGQSASLVPLLGVSGPSLDWGKAKLRAGIR